MSEDHLRDVLNELTIVGFAFFLLVSLVKMLARWWRHRRLGQRPPLLLYRDLVLIGALAVLLFFPAIYALVTNEAISDNVWWVVLRAVVGVGAMAYWAWIEWVQIGRNGEVVE